MTTKEILQAARKLIEAGWTQGAHCRDDAGNPCEYKNATCFCAVGAVDAITRNRYCDAKAAAAALRKATGYESVVIFNDMRDRTKAQVLAAFDQAIQEVE